MFDDGIHPYIVSPVRIGIGVSYYFFGSQLNPAILEVETLRFGSSVCKVQIVTLGEGACGIVGQRTLAEKRVLQRLVNALLLTPLLEEVGNGLGHDGTYLHTADVDVLRVRLTVILQRAIAVQHKEIV